MPDIQKIANSKTKDFSGFSGFVPTPGIGREAFALVGIIDGICCGITADDIKSCGIEFDKLADIALERVNEAKAAAGWNREDVSEYDVTPERVEELIKEAIERHKADGPK